MVMRVWVLASCGSLLALSACSAEPTTTAQPNPLDASDEDLPSADFPASLDHTPGTAVDIDRALSRPELRPTRSQRAPVPSPARTQRTALTPEQLRDRVDQIRAQQVQRSRAAGRIPGMAQTRTLPQVSQSDVTDVSLRPGMVPTATLAITPLTPPPQPTLAPVSPGPSATSTPSAAASVTPQPNLDNRVAVDLGEASTQATDLGIPEPATLARNFPLRSTAHQSDGARHSQDDVVISVAQPSDSPGSSDSSDLAEGAQPEILGRGTDGGINAAHHSPWITAEQTASEPSSQPLFAQAQPSPATEPASLTVEPDAEAPPPAELSRYGAAQPEAVQPETVQPEAAQIESSLPELSQNEAPEVVPSSAHWSVTGPEVSVSAVPMAMDSPRFADPNAHQRSEMVVPSAITASTEPVAVLPHSEDLANSESAPHCEPPALAKPLPSDTLADSAILEAKGIPTATAAEEIAVVDCP